MHLTKALCFACIFFLSSEAFELKNLSHLRDSLLNQDADAEALLNDTINYVDARAAYDAKVMMVDLDQCKNALSDDEFYKGFVVSTYGFKGAFLCMDYTSYRAGKDTVSTSSTWGPAYSKPSTQYHTWEWLQFPSRQDIRNYRIEFEFRAWNAMPQMYFPLLSPNDARIGGRLAYMLWVKPSKKLVGNSSAYHEMGGCGFIRPPAATLCKYAPTPQKRMLWHINLASLIRGIGSDLSVDSLKGYTYKGIEYETTGDLQTVSNSYTDKNQFSLIPTLIGIAGEPMCGYAVAAMENAAVIMEKLSRILPWLNA